MSDSTETHTAIDTSSSQGTQDASSSDWRAGLDQGLGDFARTKGWKSPADAISSYQALEQAFGHAPLRVPGNTATEEEWARVYDALGRPKGPEAYGLKRPDDLPADIPYDDGAAQHYAAVFHKIGLTARQAAALHKEYNAMQQKLFSQYVEGKEKAYKEAEAALNREWGIKYDANKEAASRALRHFAGDDAAEIAAQMKENPKLARLFHRVYQQFGDDQAVTPRDVQGGGRLGNMGADAISAMQSDPAFIADLYGKNGAEASRRAKVKWEAALERVARETETQ